MVFFLFFVFLYINTTSQWVISRGCILLYVCVSWLTLNAGNEQAQPWYHSWINWSAVPLFTQLMTACSFLLSGSIRDQIRHCSCPTIAVVAAQKSKIWIMVDLRSSDIEMYKLQGKKMEFA